MSNNRIILDQNGIDRCKRDFDGYGAETLHGRAVPFATGVKLANPELTVLIAG